MKGKIRPTSRRSRCPACDETFDYAEDFGYFCKNCQDEHGTPVLPDRFYIDLWYKNKNITICSDKTGQPLDTYERARRMLAHINVEIDTHVFDFSKYKKSEQKEFYIDSLLDIFYAYKIASIAPSYQRGYKQYVAIAKDFFNVSDIRDLRKKDLISYKDHLEKMPSLSSKTIKNILDHFKTFLRFCRDELELYDKVPSFPSVEVPEYRFKWLNRDDQIRLFELIPVEDKPIFAFLILHGCRPSEARALKCKDVSLETQSITISSTFSGVVLREKRKGRHSKSVVIPIHPEMFDYISDRVRNNLPGAFLFVSKRGSYYSPNKIRRIWSYITEKAGIKGVRLYDATRHSFASQLVNSGTSIFKISKLLGHSSIKMTEKYAHADIESLRTDMEKLSLNPEQTLNSKIVPLNKFNKNNKL